MEMARGAKPELFMGQSSRKKKGNATRLPLKAGTIQALRVFLPNPGEPQ